MSDYVGKYIYTLQFDGLLCVELENQETNTDNISKDLKELAQAHPHTSQIDTILFHPSFPVDIRHNAKIGREKLSVWATEQLS